VKHFIFFDTDAATSQVADEVSFAMRGMVGATSAEILTSVGVGPGFCIIVETDDNKDAEVTLAIDRGLAGFADNLRNVAHRRYRKVG
jgi:hypothetical protein